MFNVGSVQGYLKLNTTGWTGPMKSAQMSMVALSRTFTKTGAIFLGAIAVIEREFGKFDKAIRHATSVTLTLTEKQFSEMSDMALDASVKWNKAATDTAQAFYFLGSAGLTASEQMEAFNDTIMLSRAMGSSLSQTVEGMVDIVRAFGLEFADVTNIADQLTKTVTSSNQMFQDLDKALSYASSTARLTNNTLAETNAMLGVMANAGIKGCYDDKTEVLTKRGWIRWQDVSTDDEFATRNTNTGALEYQKSIRLIRYHHKGKMYHVSNRGVDLCVTPDHRMWAKRRDHKEFKIMTASEVDGKNVRYEAGGLKWVGKDSDFHKIDGFMQGRGSWEKKVRAMKIKAETWAAFLGWYISEGSCDLRKGCYRIRITQNPGVIRDKMRDGLYNLPVTVNEDKNGFIINNEQIWRAVEPLGKAPQKHVPDYALNWSPRLLSILLNALMDGDGDCNECYYTSSKRLADNVMEIALKMGVSATAVIKTKAGSISNYDKEGREIKAKYDQWKVSIKREQLEPAYYPSDYTGVHGDRLDGSKFPNKSEWIDYDGEVFCAEVPNHLLIVRRNGKPIVSGNSMAGTVLRRAMTNLMSPTAGMNALMYELGLNVYDTTGTMKPFIDIIGEISERLVGTSNAYKNMVFEVLFGRRAIAGQITLFNYGAKSLRKYADEIKNAGGTTQKVADKQMKAFTEILGQMFREIQRAAIEIGEVLAPAIARVSEQIRNSISGFREYVQANKDAVMSVMKWTTALSALLLIGGPVLLIITSLITNMVKLAAVIANPFVALVISLYVLKAVWNQTSKDIIQTAKETFAAIAYEKIGGAGIALSLGTMGAVGGTIIGGPIGAGVGGAIGLGLGMFAAKDSKIAYDNYIETGKKTTIDLKALWSETSKAVNAELKADFGAGLDFVDNAIDNTDGTVGKLLKGLKDYMSGVKGLLGSFMNEPAKGAVATANEEIKKLDDTMEKFVGGPLTQWSIATSEYFKIGAAEVNQWADSFMSAMGSVQSSWTDTIETVINEGGNLQDFLENMFLGILKAFNRMIAEVAAADLMYAIAGGGQKRTAGTPSLLKYIIPKFGEGPESASPVIDAVTGGGGGTGKVAINITNNGNPVKLTETGRRFDGKQYVINMVMDEMSTNPSFAKAVRGR